MNEHVRRPVRTATVGGVLKRVVTVDDLNSRFALLQQDGSPSVYVSRHDFLPIQDQDLKRRLAGEVVETGQKDSRPVYADAYRVLTGNAHRHIYRRIVFSSGKIGDDALNLFKGLGVRPKPGKIDLILKHLREVICKGNERDSDALLKLLAWQLQNIGKPSRIVVILKSEKQQAGKGILLGELMAKIYGPSAVIAASTDQILGRFNSAVRGCAFAFLDEVLFAGDRKAADGVKSLSTATITGIEEKGLPVVQCPVAVNLWLASNHENAAHIEEGDARYWVLEVSEDRIGDADYFTELMNEVENGGREAFAHYLLNLDVAGFVPSRDVPKDNAAKAAMVRASVNPFDGRKWLDDCIASERIVGMKHQEGSGWAEWTEGEVLLFASLADAYTEWQKTVRSPVAAKPTPRGSLGEVLRKAGFEEANDYRARRRRVPAIETARHQLWT